MKSGLNQEFYEWIDDVRRAFRRKEELENELKELERKLVGYNAVTYDFIGNRVGSLDQESKILNIISKIERVSKKIKSAERLTSRFNKVFSNLKVEEKYVLNMLVNSDYNTGKIVDKLKISKNRFYSIINKLVKVFNHNLNILQ